MIIEFYDRSVSTRYQNRRSGFLFQSGDGIVGTSREVFVENVKLARCTAVKSLKEWVAYHKRKYAVKSKRQTGSERQRMQDANIIKLYRRAGASSPRGGRSRSRRDGKRMEATEKRRCKNQKPRGNYENIKVSHAQSRSKKKLVGVALQVPGEEKRFRRGHWGTKTREAEKNKTKCESLPKRRVREPEVRANRDQTKFLARRSMQS